MKNTNNGSKNTNNASIGHANGMSLRMDRYSAIDFVFYDMLSPKARRNFNRIMPFGILWLLFSLAYTLLERGLLGTARNYPSTGNPYSFSHSIVLTPLTAMVTGLLIGILEIAYFNKMFIQKSFAKKIVLKSFIYLAIILTFMVITTAIANLAALRTSVFDSRVWERTETFFTNFAFFSVLFYIALAILVSQFYLEVSDNLGHGVLNNFLTGRYHRPSEEERIFMFLDMRSSSMIAEHLGHVRYFEMLKQYYSDFSDSIIRYSGEIYQYVGDEIVVSWKLKQGLKDNNCIQCFFAMKKTIKAQAKKYNEKFGVLPEFKAGFHCGKVTTGEIGEIKKEIIFTGDVLNATSRIQGLCNFHKVDVLISIDLVKLLQPDFQSRLKSVGENELRGKEEKIELFTMT